MNTIVFAFQPLQELAGQVGIVECEESLAARLIAEDLVDDPRIGDRHFREIVSVAAAPAPKPETPDAPRETPAQDYATRDMRPTRSTRRPDPAAPKRKPGRPRKNPPKAPR